MIWGNSMVFNFFFGSSGSTYKSSQIVSEKNTCVCLLRLSIGDTDGRLLNMKNVVLSHFTGSLRWFASRRILIYFNVGMAGPTYMKNSNKLLNISIKYTKKY